MNVPMFTRFGLKTGLTVALALAVTAAAQQTTGNWHTFTDTTGRFFIPGARRAAAPNAKGRESQRRAHRY